MSRSYRVLALAVVAVLLLVGVAKIVGRDATTTQATAGGDGLPTQTTGIGATTVPSGDATPGDVTDVIDGDEVGESTVPPAPTADCTITGVLKQGAAGEEVRCLETQLAAAGFDSTIDATFDSSTDAAVRAYQEQNSLAVDGIVGRLTAQAMGIWAGPLGPMPATNDDCPPSRRGAIVDRANQRGALCENGAIAYEFPLTSAWSQPDPGTYQVYAKDINASSTLSGQYSTMTHFVAFTRGKYQGARIAFHSMPKYSNGKFVNPLDTVGELNYRGESAGCLRVLPDDAVRIWDWLSIGDDVRVIS